MNSDRLNDIIRKKSKCNNNLAHHFHQMFFFEHILMRIEKSKYKNTFNQRNTRFDINTFKEIVEILEENNNIKRVFSDYQAKL